MDTKKPFPSAILAGACFAIVALLALVDIVRFFSFGNLVYLLALIVLALAFLMSKRDILPIGGFALLALSEIIFFFAGMSYKFTVYDWYWDETRFNFFTLIPSLLELAAFLTIFVFVLIALNDIIGQDLKDKIKKLWFVPAALLLAGKLFALILHFIFRVFANVDWYFGFSHVGNLFTMLVLAAGFLFGMMYIFYPDGLSKNAFAFNNQSHPYAENNSFGEGGSDNMNNTQYTYNSQSTHGAQTSQSAQGTQTAYNNTYGNSYNPYNVDIRQAYFSLVAHILLLLFTFGIWSLVWIYRTTKYLNCIPGEEYRNPTTKLLLCMFVPFYIWYWTYKTGQRVDKLSESKGMASDLAIICLLLAIFIGIIPPILLQDRINNIVDIMNGKSVGGAAYQQAYQQTYQQPANSQAAAQQSTPQQTQNAAPQAATPQHTPPQAAPAPAPQTVPTSAPQQAPKPEPQVTPTTAPQASETQSAQAQTLDVPTSEVPQATPASSEAPQVPSSASAISTAMSTVEEIKAYKELLDMGAITQEEFDAKKKQLLGL